jgi:hypothetical protein
MLSIPRFTTAALAAAFGAALFSGPASAQTMPGERLTAVQKGSLHARRLLPNGATLSGRLLQVTTCNAVKFQLSPARIVPPVYRAVTYPVRKGPCGQVVFYAPASIKIPPNLRAVRVQATNGSFLIKVL